jgi:hypothetical protein
MHDRDVLETPPAAPPSVGPWIEISAWILAFAVLLAAQCAPERLSVGGDAGAGPAAETHR